MRRFEVAKKIINGIPQMIRNVETGQEEIAYWDVGEDCMPEYATTHAAGADFRAAEDVVVKSIWSKVATSLVSKNGDILTNWVDSFFKINGDVDITLSSQIKENKRRAMEPTVIHTGIKVYMEEDEVFYICNRSSGPKKLGLVLANSIGVIDADYADNETTDGEIMFAYYNFLPFDITIKKGDKIGQGIFQKFLRAENAKVGEKRKGGFGSTDKQESTFKGVNLGKGIHID